MVRGRIVVLGALAVVLATACEARGGGWLISDTGSGKATFGFEMECDPDTGELTAQVQYVDRPAGVAIHGVTSANEFFCFEDATFGTFSGTYTAQPRTAGDGGTFFVTYADNGEPGVSAGDEFSIELIGGVYDGYANGGTIGGGNVQAR